MSSALRKDYCKCSSYLRRVPKPRELHSTIRRSGNIAAPNAWNAFVGSPKVGSHSGTSSIAIKDNICTRDFPTTCSSEFLKKFEPGYDATVVHLLRQNGYEISGKTNCDEFGMGSLNTNTIHGAVVNPFHAMQYKENVLDRPRAAGGSSGGSAAVVCAGLTEAAIGTDTGGSIRLPAAYCGVTGFKPSYGMVSRWGVVSYADSLDCVGVFAKTCASAKQVFDCISKYDHKDPTSAVQELRVKAQQQIASLLKLLENLQSSQFKGLRIGIPQEYFPAELDPSFKSIFRNFVMRLKEGGAELVPVTLPSTPYALSAYYVIASAEASSNLARYDGQRFGTYTSPVVESFSGDTAELYAASRSRGFGAEVQKRLLLGTYALTADAFDNYFLQAHRVRNLIKSDFDDVFRQQNVLKQPTSRSPITHSSLNVDLLVHLSAITTAPLLSRPPSGTDGYVQDIMTVPASLAGLPALSLPAGVAEDGWPVGVSLVGQWGCDELLLRVGQLLQESSD